MDLVLKRSIEATERQLSQAKRILEDNYMATTDEMILRMAQIIATNAQAEALWRIQNAI